MTQPPPDGPQDRERWQVPLSRPPRKSANWWKSIPGQLSIVVIVGGVLVILCQVMGIVNFRG